MIKLLGCEESISNQYTLLTTVERGEGRLEFLFWHQPAKFEKAVGLKPQRNLRRISVDGGLPPDPGFDK